MKHKKKQVAVNIKLIQLTLHVVVQCSFDLFSINHNQVVKSWQLNVPIHFLRLPYTFRGVSHASDVARTV